MENAEQVSSILQALHARNICLCIDDFGTGYSSLSYLSDFPFDVMKIDRAFVSNLQKGSKHFNLIHTMTQLANNLGMDIIVEGVETSQELEQLKALGCQKGQGYLFARALSCQEVESLLA